MKIALAIFLAIIVLFAVSDYEKNTPSLPFVQTISEVTSVQSMSLSTSSFWSGSEEYELVIENEVAELRYYADEYVCDEFVHVLKQSAVVETEELVELMNSCGVARWNGFNKNDEGVLDGTSFSFTADVNDGETISAGGYSKFPDGYGKFTSELDRLLEEGD